MLHRDDVVEQAEKFLLYYERDGARWLGDFEAMYDFWADGKDFWPNDKAAIRREIVRMLSVPRETSNDLDDWFNWGAA